MNETTHMTTQIPLLQNNEVTSFDKDTVQNYTALNRRKREIEIVKDDTFAYDGYQVVRGEFFSHTYEPSISFCKSKISLNTACIRKLPDVEYVQMLVNPETKKIAVRPCEENEKDSFKWRSSNTKKLTPKQITCRIFFAKIFSLMGWNPDYRYKLLGKLIQAGDELLFIFDLTTPEIYQSKKKEGKETGFARTPIFPEDWKDQFGIPVEEHRKSLQVNLFDGYAVFEIQKQKPTVSTVDLQNIEMENSYDGEQTSIID